MKGFVSRGSSHLLLLCSAFGMSACGLNSAKTLRPPTSPVAQVITLSSFDSAVPAGTLGFRAVATGSGFTPSTELLWNGVGVATSYQTSGILYATISTSLLAVPGTANILVKDTSTGAVSNSLAFPILSPAALTATVLSLVSSGHDGSPANGDSLVQPSISSTGRFVAFQSAGTNLVTQQVITPWEDIYLADTCLGAATPCTPSTQLITVSADGKTGGNAQSRSSTVSQDGRYVAFDSGATNLLDKNPTYCNSMTNCVLIRDTCMGVASGCVPRTVLGSILPGELGAGGGLPVITPSGRFLTFDSNGAGSVQVYLRDLCVGALGGCVPNTIQSSLNSSGVAANQGAKTQALSADGRFVSFVSYSTNLVDLVVPESQGTAMMFVRDTCIGSSGLCTPSTSRIDVPNNGGTANNSLDPEAAPSVSSSGRYISYSSNATNLVSQNVQGLGNVYLRDTCVGVVGCITQNLLVSVANDGSVANSGSHQQSMSADGRFVAFTSIATNLVGYSLGPAGSREDVYVRDTCTDAPASCHQSTVAVAVTLTPYYQNPSNAGASWPAISADGHYVAYLSSSSNLTPAGTGGHIQVFISKTGF